MAAAAEFADDVADEFFGVAEQHQSVVEVIERIVDAGETGGHAAFDDHDGARFVHVDDGHAEDGAGWSVRAAGLVTSFAPITRATSVCGSSPLISSISIKLVVGNVRFGEQNVHVAGHAAGDGVNAELHVDAAFGEDVVEFADFVLRLGDGHAVAGNDDDRVGSAKNRGGFFGDGALNRTLFLCAGGRLNLAERRQTTRS